MDNTDKRLLLLGLLRIQKMHGYQLQQFLDEHMQFLSTLKASTAYYTLERMAEEGLVEAKSERAGNRPTRQVYCLTVQGEERFNELLEENLASYDFEETADDIGVAFLTSLPSAKARKLLASKRTRIEEKLAEVRAALGKVGEAETLHLFLLRARLKLEVDLQWIDEVMRIVKSAASVHPQ